MAKTSSLNPPYFSKSQQRKHVPDRASWPAVYSLSLGAFGLVTSELLPVSLLTPMAIDLGVSNGVIGQTMTVAALAAAIAGPVLILGSGRLNRRMVLWSLLGLLVISSAITALATDMAVLLLARALLGFAVGGFWAMLTMLALRLVPPHQVPRAMAVILMGISVGTTVSTPLGAMLGDLFGWRTTFLLTAGLGIVTLAIQLFTLPSLPATAAPSVRSFTTVLARPRVLLGFATVLLGVSGHLAAFTFIRPFLETTPRLEVSTISLALFAYGGGGFVGNLVWGAIAARSAAIATASSTLGVALSILALMVAGTHPGVAFAATALWGFAFGGFPVSAAIWNARATPETDLAESSGALHSTVFHVALGTGGAVGGILIDGVGSQGLLLYAAIVLMTAALLMLTLGRSRWINERPQRLPPAESDSRTDSDRASD
ncbi:MFS transporter [Pseudochrobactrum sp. B5]|uniref:MFS transporter n=1 Tax=Pseudochrobactrum sp. B5 TaxID=1289478 RepID=UPI000ADB07F1|nr:MFS transporter [Pseudochrobactrum sp. B5]